MTDRIEKTVLLRAPVARVWQAVSDAAEFARWFGLTLDSGFVPGEVTRGRIHYPGYEKLVWEAKVVAMDPPRRFAFEWHPYAVDPAIDYSGEPPTLVEFLLAPEGGGTRLAVIESGFDGIPPHRRAEALSMNDGGWEAQIGNIRDHVDG